MMARLVSVVIAVLVIAAATLFVASARTHVATASEQVVMDEPVLVAQAPGPGPGPGGPGGRMTEAERARMREQMMDRLLDHAQLTDRERAAAKKALAAKADARQVLGDQLAKLRGAADKPNATDNELKQALTAYRAAIAQYGKTVAAADEALVGQLSIKSEARCMALGILENGLGGPGGMGRPGMGGDMPRRGGAGPRPEL